MYNKEITIFESLDSTNNYAMQKIHAGMAAHGEVILALQQTKGKGQHGREWLAEKGKSILMSTVLNLNMPNSAIFPISINQQFELSALAAVAVRDWFAFYAGDNVFIKWPNDIYYNDRKAGGILIENIIGQWAVDIGQRLYGTIQSTENNLPTTDYQMPTTSWKWAIVGIGININQSFFSENLLNPISLKQITGKEYSVVELAKDLSDFLEKYWTKWINGDWKEIYSDYNKNLYKRGQKVRLRKGNVIIPCTLKSVSENGKLLIEEDDTVEFTVGEVVWQMRVDN